MKRKRDTPVLKGTPGPRQSAKSFYLQAFSKSGDRRRSTWEIVRQACDDLIADGNETLAYNSVAKRSEAEDFSGGAISDRTIYNDKELRAYIDLRRGEIISMSQGGGSHCINWGKH